MWNIQKNKWDSVKSKWNTGEDVWVSHFDDTEWEPTGVGFGFWNGTQWESEFNDPNWSLVIEDIATWASGYRPTKMRLTWTGPATIDSFVMQDDIGGVISLEVDIVSLGEIDLTFAATDGFKITMGGNDSQFLITNIEFL